MGFVIQAKKVFIVACKTCLRHVPAQVPGFPRGSITVRCPLCGEHRAYRSSEVYLGRPDWRCK